MSIYSYAVPVGACYIGPSIYVLQTSVFPKDVIFVVNGVSVAIDVLPPGTLCA